MKAISIVLLLLLAVSTYAQTAHSVTLTATDSTDFTSANAGTITFYRVVGSCPASGVPTGGVALNTTPLAFPGTQTFTDTAVTAGSTYCYYAIAVPASGGAGVDSNTFPSTIQFGTLTLTGTSK